MKVTYYAVGDLGTNCYIFHDSCGHAAIIDPGWDAKRILADVKLNNLTVDFILLTHAHFDHIMAAGTLREATGAQLCVGAKEAAMLCNARANLSAMVYPEKAIELTADNLLAEGDVIHIGEETLTVMETPGHTQGGVCYIGDGVLFSGDTLFAGSVGRTDLPGGDLSLLRHSLARLALLEGEYIVYPGHGEETTLSYEKTSNPYLVG